MSKLFIAELEIPKGLPGISDLFKNVRLCNNGSLIVCYRQPVELHGVNRGDDVLFSHWAGYTVLPGSMLALDIKRLG